MTFKPERQKLDCQGCITGSLTVEEARRGAKYCAPCRDNIKRLLRSERLLDANERVRT